MSEDNPYDVCITEASKAFEGLAEESERGAVLLGAEYFSDLLMRLLQKRLVEDAVSPGKPAMRLFDFNCPLGTFSSRIQMAYATGCITKSQLRKLEALRAVRNELAHSFLIVSVTQLDTTKGKKGWRMLAGESPIATPKQTLIATFLELSITIGFTMIQMQRIGEFECLVPDPSLKIGFKIGGASQEFTVKEVLERAAKGEGSDVSTAM